MEKTQELEKLFDKWSTTHKFEVFCKDGIVDEKTFNQAETKILFVLKDLHLKYDVEKYKEIGYIDMREFVSTEGGMWKTVEAWAEPFFDDASKEGILKKVAFLNLKKEHGEASVSDKCVLCYSKRDSDFIKKQIKIINPDIVIACSNAVYNGLKEVFEIQEEQEDSVFKKIVFNDKMSDYGEYFDVGSLLNIDKQINVVHYRHPSMGNRQGTKEEHQENMLKIRESIQNKKLSQNG